MNIQVLKTELSFVVPMELLQNADYWYRIRDSFEQGLPMMSHAFLSYLYGKYGYDINILKSQEIVSYLLELARGLYEKTYWDVGHINSRPRGVSEILSQREVWQQAMDKAAAVSTIKIPGTMILPTQKEIEQFSSGRQGGYYKLNPKTGKYEVATEIMYPTKSYSTSYSWISKPRIKDRKTLCEETPTAEFTDITD